MKADTERALDECLAMLRHGADVAACLERYPDLAGELRPLLELAASLRRVRAPMPSAEARAAGLERMRAALVQRRSRPGFRARATTSLRRALAWTTLRPVWQTAGAVLLAVLVLAGGATAAAAAGSLPGDGLYPVKLAGQQARLALTLNPARREMLQKSFQEQRLEDVRTVLPRARGVHVEFEGELQEMQDGVWTVGGLPAAIRDVTAVSGQPYHGALVRVRGYLPGNGQVQVTEITVEPEESREVEPVRSEDPERPTQPATATRAAEPTEAPEAHETAVPDGEPQPAQDSEPAEHPEASRTAEPTEHPEQTAKPDETPHATETAEPGHTPHATETAKPDHTPEPTETGKPTEHPEHGTAMPESSPAHENGDG